MFTFSPALSQLYTYLSDTNSLDMHVRLQSKVRSCGELSDAELGRGELHRCHLLAEVGRHHMLTQDQHCVGIVGRQQVQVRAPLKWKV